MSKNPKLIFYGGVGEIGGNKILLDDNGTRIFLDFGVSFERRRQFFEEYLTPRTANGIGDFFATNLLPDCPGIYRNDLLQQIGRRPEDIGVQAVILSHAHKDHSEYISFLREDIPIWAGSTAKSILEAVDEYSLKSLESEVLSYKKRPIKNWEKPVQRKFNTFRTGDKIKIDSIEIEPVHVDHSLPGAYGFIVHTSEGAVIYTGDLRLHGTKPEMTMDFVKKAEESKPIAMISEGTRINVERNIETEGTVYSEGRKVAEETKSLLISDFDIKNVDRLNTFYKIATDTGRQMVINFKHACILEKFINDLKLNVPEIKEILLLKPKRRTGTGGSVDYPENYIRQRLNYPNIITPTEINKNQKNYLMILAYWDFPHLIDLMPETGSTYIHSSSEPFNEDMEVSAWRKENWLTRFKLRKAQAHCSGHASGQDLEQIIREINPKALFPIHTEHPDTFVKLSQKTTIVEEGKEYPLVV